jgi:sensor histidine kinase YesM
VGLKNVRERLQRISGGELRVDSVIGKGTTVTMILPKNA